MSDAEDTTLSVEVHPDLNRKGLRALSSYLVSRLATGAFDKVVLDVGSVRSPTAAHLDALARLQLTAHRHGAVVRLVGACHALTDLLALSGLSDVIRPEPDHSRGFEAHGQSEHGE